MSVHDMFEGFGAGILVGFVGANIPALLAMLISFMFRLFKSF